MIALIADGTCGDPNSEQPPQAIPEATLIAPTPVPIYAKGQIVGNVTLPAGTAVGILSANGETTLAGTRFGQISLPTTALAPTGKIYTGEVACQPARETPTPAPNLRPSGVAGFKGLPSGKEEAEAHPTLEARVLTLTNIERAKMGRKPLSWDENLARAARYHAQDMAAERYYTHESQDRVGGELKRVCKSFDRIDRFTKNCGAENIAFGNPTPEDAVRAWMNSPGHRENILDPELNSLGVGICHGYWVQDFGW